MVKEKWRNLKLERKLPPDDSHILTPCGLTFVVECWVQPQYWLAFWSAAGLCDEMSFYLIDRQEPPFMHGGKGS